MSVTFIIDIRDVEANMGAATSSKLNDTMTNFEMVIYQYADFDTLLDKSKHFNITKV